MPKRDVQRLELLTQSTLSAPEIARRLKLSVRQVRRLRRRFAAEGLGGLADRRCPPRQHLPPEVRAKVLELARTSLRDFGPTLFAEYLAEHYAITVSRETLRVWLTAEKLHRPRKRKSKPRPLRERRMLRGDLVQIDGSHHAWFEERAPKCCLTLAIDDATSEILGAVFQPAETTQAYFDLFAQTFRAHGLPQTLYSDQHGIFRVNTAQATHEMQTQLQRALEELEVDLICARTPQAKGRVERAFNTLQDRWVKYFRFNHISSIEEAHAVLPELITRHNRQFAHDRDQESAFRPTDAQALHHALVHKFQRVVSRNATVQFNDNIYAVEAPFHVPHRARITIATYQPLQADWNGKPLALRYLGRVQRAGHIVDAKEINATCERPRQHHPEKAHKPSKDHPWVKAGKLAYSKKLQRQGGVT